MTHNYFTHFLESITTLIAFPIWKVFILSAIILYEFFFGVANGVLINAVLGLVLLDFASGVFASAKCGEKIESRRAVKTVFKLGAYSLMLSAGHLLEVSIVVKVFSQEAVIAAIAGTEFISIMENLSKAGYVVPRKLIARIKEMDLLQKEKVKLDKK